MGSDEQRISKVNRFELGAAGVLTGFINGLLGSGGGVLIVLYLTLLKKNEQKNAQATAIAVILPLTILSSIIYTTGGYVEWSPLWKVSLGGIAGAILGAVLLNKLKSRFLKKIFGIFLIIAGIRMLL
jgi:hypothetical protein